MKKQPEWANWRAQDACGWWCWFERKPYADGYGEWQAPSGAVQLSHKGEPNDAWEQTLECVA